MTEEIRIMEEMIETEDTTIRTIITTKTPKKNIPFKKETTVEKIITSRTTRLLNMTKRMTEELGKMKTKEIVEQITREQETMRHVIRARKSGVEDILLRKFTIQKKIIQFLFQPRSIRKSLDLKMRSMLTNREMGLQKKIAFHMKTMFTSLRMLEVEIQNLTQKM
jgi:hypothetical protein